MQNVGTQNWLEIFEDYSNTSLGTCAFIIVSSYFFEIENIDPLKTKEYSDEEKFFMLRHSELMCYIASALKIKKDLAPEGFIDLEKIEQLSDTINDLFYTDEDNIKSHKALINAHNKLVRTVYAQVRFETVVRWMHSQSEGKNLLPPTLIEYIEAHPAIENIYPLQTEIPILKFFLEVEKYLKLYEQEHMKRTNDALPKRVRDCLYKMNQEAAKKCGIVYSNPANFDDNKKTVKNIDIPKLKKFYPSLPNIEF